MIGLTELKAWEGYEGFHKCSRAVASYVRSQNGRSLALDFEYPKRIRFTCNRCGLCCGDTDQRNRRILLLEIEAKRIAEETSMSINEFAERTEGFEPYTYLVKKNVMGKCVFLGHGECVVYEMRPLVCRFYPFELKNTGDDTYSFVHTVECPCIGTGPELEKRYFEELFDAFLEEMKANVCGRESGLNVSRRRKV